MGLLNRAKKIRDNLIYNIMENYIEIEECNHDVSLVQGFAEPHERDSDNF